MNQPPAPRGTVSKASRTTPPPSSGHAVHPLTAILDNQANVVWANPAWTETLGYSLEELVGRPIASITHADDVGEVEDAMKRLEGGAAACDVELRIRDREGDYRWLIASASLVDREIHVAAIDITARKRAELENEQKIEWLEMAERLASVGYWRVDYGARRVVWSSEVYRIHGVDPNAPGPTLEEAIDWYHPDERERVSALIDAAVSSGEALSFESRIVRADGEVRHVRAIGRCEVQKSGFRELFGTFIDITEQRRLEESLRRRDRMAVLGQMAGVMAHEINNPLTYIIANADHLRNIVGDPSQLDQAREMLDELERGAEKIAAVVKDLERLSRQGRAAATPKPIDVASELETALRLSTLKLKGKASVVASIVPLPPVVIEDGALIHVFGNLLANSVQAISAKGPGKHTISVETGVGDGAVWVEITDTGVGMTPQQRANAFVPFYSAKHPGAGTGVGLTVAKQVVEAAQGSIRIQSREGRGTTVRVELPVHDG